MFDTANYSYIIPFHRLTSYVTGILLGYVLRKYGKEFKMKSSHLRLGWTVMFSLLSYVFTKAYEMNNLGYKNDEAGIYAALAPMTWSFFMAWIIFVTEIGSGGSKKKNLN